jgi:glycosyltransferase involved in cell wall biosynthesis
MAGLVKALANQGVSVSLVVQQEMSADRAAQGWSAPDIGKAKLLKAETADQMRALAASAHHNVIHICQGIRGNGVIRQAQKTLVKLKRRQFVVMETVDDAGLRGYLKRATYRFLFRRLDPYLTGLLLTGAKTRDWAIARGVDARKAFPFAYFLPDALGDVDIYQPASGSAFRILFVGQFIERKRLDLLLRAIAKLNTTGVQLVVVGSGPLENELKELASKCIPGKIEWVGKLPMVDVRTEMFKADCLVLPSRHDGWGAVVSEALMSGTPAICSDSCGAACIVPRGKYGNVFETDNVDHLVKCLERIVSNGKLEARERLRLAKWARCLGADEGAKYLLEVINAAERKTAPPLAPWKSSFVAL